MNQGVIGYAATAFVGFISLGCEIAAAAESTESNERGFYVGASVSRVEHEVRAEAFPQVAVRLSWGAPVLMQLDQISVDDTDTGWNLTLGYRVNKYLSAELSYYDFGEAVITKDYSSVVTVPYALYYNTRHKIEASGPSVSLLGTFPLTSSLDIFARGGMLFLDHEVETRITSNPPDVFRSVPFRGTDEIDDAIWVAGAGVQWSFASHWQTRLEYQLTENIDIDEDEWRADRGTTKLEQVSLSVLFHF